MKNESQLLTEGQLEEYDANNPSPIRLLAEETLNSGEVTDNCTLADAKAALERRLPPQ